MNKMSLFFLIVFALFPLSADAKIVKYVAVGVTRATLHAEGGNSDWGEFVGLGLEYASPCSLLLGIEAAYATKKVTLENKSWPSSWYPPFSNVSIGDIPINGSYLELFVNIGYCIHLVNKQVAIKLLTGPSISLQLRYIGDFRLPAEFHLDPDEVDKYKFDYLRIDSEGASTKSINSITGVVVSYKTLGAEIRYARSFTKSSHMLDLSINDRLDCFYILLRYAF